MRGYVVTLAVLSGLAGLVADAGEASGQEAGVGLSTVCPNVGEVPLDELLRCQARQAAERIDGLRAPGADALSDLERDSLRSACSRAGLLGSAALERCEARQLSALERVPRPAGISGLSDADSATLMAACAEASRIGPAELRRCQARQLAAIRPGQAPASSIDNRATAGPGAASLAPAPPPPSELTPEDVVELQELLAAIGHDPGPADGLLGPATARAISRYEQSIGRAATGRATLALLEQLRFLQPEEQVAQPEAETVQPEPQVAEPAPEAVQPEPQRAEPAPPVPDAQVAVPDLPQNSAPDVAPNSPGGSPTSPSPAPPQAATPQRPEGLLPTEIYLTSKDTIWLVIAGENMAAFEDPSGLSVGAAVAVAPDRLLTACHVIEALEIISIWQGDFFASAELLDADYESDRCVLVPNKMELSAIARVRGYDELEVGERVFTIGSPSGLEQTLGEGLISSLRVDDGLPLIETTAPISPGSSGGGLFDDQGNLIGITTFLPEGGQQLNVAIAADSFGVE